MPFNEKRRKVSFSATPQVKFLEQASSSKTVSSISVVDESIDLTAEYTNALDETKNESETIDLGSVINTISKNKNDAVEPNKNIEEQGKLEDEEKMILCEDKDKNRIENNLVTNQTNDASINNNEVSTKPEHDAINIDSINVNKTENLTENNKIMTCNFESDTTQLEQAQENNTKYINTKQDMSETIDLFNDVDIEKELFGKNNNFDKKILSINEIQNDNNAEDNQKCDENGNESARNQINSEQNSNIKYNTTGNLKLRNVDHIKYNANDNTKIKNADHINSNNIDNIKITNADHINSNNIDNIKITNVDNIKYNTTDNFKFTNTDANNLFYTTKDLKSIFLTQKVNIMEVLEKHRIKFVDKNTITKRKTISRQNKVKPQLLYYYKYFALEFYNHFNRFINFLDGEIQKKQENIARLENESYDVANINFNGIKKNCRIFAMNEWYLKRIEREDEFNAKLQVNKNILNQKLKINNYKEELNTMVTRNEELKRKIEELNQRKAEDMSKISNTNNLSSVTNNENFNTSNITKEMYNNATKFESYQNNIKNYFKKNPIFSESFVNENLSYKNLMENKMEDFLVKEIEIRKRKEKEKRVKKEKLENEIKETNKQIEKYKNNRSVGIKDTENEKKKMELYLKMNKIKIDKICKNDIKFEIGEVCLEMHNNSDTNLFTTMLHLNLKCLNDANLRDFYNFEMQQIEKKSIKEILHSLNEMKMLCKEIKNKEYEYANNCFSIRKGNKLIKFNMKEIEIREDDVTVYKGKREYGMIEI